MNGRVLTMVDEKYLTSDEIMSYLKISKPTLYRYIKAGMPVIRVSKKKNLFDISAVDKWLKQRSE